MPLPKRLPKQLYAGDITKMKKEFLKLDLDGDGIITIEEAGNVLRAMRKELKASESEIRRVLRDVDMDGDGTVNLKEYFLSMKNSGNCNLIHRALVQRSKARKQFKKWDKDGNGYITVEEVKLVFKERAGCHVSTEQVEKMLKDSDKDSDGRINYEEFVAMMTQ